ncbi:MAG: hypothetical protein QNK03_24750, partial [Myxococcota bacterium]|nr:hypothetical protein [Myxococcota bacterium]
FLLEALIALDRLGECEALLAPAPSSDRAWEPDLHRLRGRLRARLGREEQAEQSLRRGVSLARERGLRAMELRTATELARFLRQAGRPEEAHAALAPICAAFDHELETPDVRAARELLAG